MKLKHWYFATNDAGIRHFDRCIRVAVKSARKNTDLKPICLYSGDGNPFIDQLAADGVEVVKHKSRLLDAINATENANGWHRDIATGANLRLDIPLIEKTEKFVLYTDCDVMFLRHPEMSSEPEFFAAAPEDRPDNWKYVNTGVMIINVESMRKEHAALVEYAAPRLNQLTLMGGGTYDQGILNSYFKRRWSRLPLEMNWKPYWGVNPNASIIHFHGPKPQFIEAIVAGEQQGVPQVYRNIFSKNPEGSLHYLRRFQDMEPPSCPYCSGAIEIRPLRPDDTAYNAICQECGVFTLDQPSQEAASAEWETRRSEYGPEEGKTPYPFHWTEYAMPVD